MLAQAVLTECKSDRLIAIPSINVFSSTHYKKVEQQLHNICAKPKVNWLGVNNL
jgi:hypothetical protein